MKPKPRLIVAITTCLFIHSHAVAQDKHDHGAEPATAKPHAGHAHDEHAGHAHDEHADEVKLTSDAIQRYGIKTAGVSVQQLKPTLTVPARVSFNTEAMAHVGAIVKGRATEIRLAWATS